MHERFQRALDDGDAQTLIGIALRAREAAHDGRFCQCTGPELVGLDLMCGGCLLNNKDQEIRKLLSLYGAHPFNPNPDSRLGWCECTYPESDPVHHGQDKPMRTTWGERFEQPYPPHVEQLRPSKDPS